jgi:cleavage and polyadenylation specificity factor subunit 1
LGDFTPPARFLHVHIGLVVPLPPSASYTYCFTAVDRFNRWPEVIPIPDITANTAASAWLTGWISRFGCPQNITTEKGWQFESTFQFLAKMCGIQLSRITAHHLAANGLVERFHQTLKAAIMFHTDQQWAEALPLVLVRIRTSLREDLQASVAELVYGEPLRILGELLTPSANPVDPELLTTELRQHMARLRPVPAARQASLSTLMHSDIEKCTHVFLRQDATHAVLEPPYYGPYQVLSQRDKTLWLLIRGRPVTMSADRVKPAYILHETNRGNNTNAPAPVNHAIAPPGSPPQPSTKTTHSCRHIHFPPRFNI